MLRSLASREWALPMIAVRLSHDLPVPMCIRIGIRIRIRIRPKHMHVRIHIFTQRARVPTESTRIFHVHRERSFPARTAPTPIATEVSGSYSNRGVSRCQDPHPGEPVVDNPTQAQTRPRPFASAASVPMPAPCPCPSAHPRHSGPWFRWL